MELVQKQIEALQTIQSALAIEAPSNTSAEPDVRIMSPRSCSMSMLRVVKNRVDPDVHVCLKKERTLCIIKGFSLPLV